MSKPKRWVFVDADVIAFRAAAGAQDWTDWGDGTLDNARWTATADGEIARKHIDQSLEELRDNLEADEIVCCLTDNVNWRMSVLETYKGNRSDTPKPILLPQCRHHLRDKHAAWQRPGLEGDDLMGILSGLSQRFPGERVIATIDKDLKTIPGLVYLWHHSVLGIQEITVEAADRFHLMQGLAGDITDGYKGCPTIGMGTAEEFLNEPYMLVPETYTPKRGKNKDKELIRWVKRETPDLWTGILSLFAKEGIEEADALKEFQVARILRSTEYNFKTKEPILWTPSLINQ